MPAVQDTTASGSDRASQVGAIIRRRREARGISLRAFARQCDLSPAHVSKIERGLASPSLVTLTRIVQELDLHGADLFGVAVEADGRARVVRASDAPLFEPEPGSPPGDEVRLVAQTPAATVLLGSGGPEHFLPPVVAPREVIVIVVDGSAEAQVGDELIALAAGDTLIVPPLAPHAIRITGGPATRTVYISSEEGQMIFDRTGEDR